MHLHRFAPALLLTIIVAACAPARSGASGEPGGPAPTAAVERFLRLSQDQEYMQMGWVFGTADGPVLNRDPASRVEQRMHALSTLLQHDGFVLYRETPVPGRAGAAVEVGVRLNRDGSNIDVPFTTVRGRGGRWFVERVGVEAVTGRR